MPNTEPTPMDDLRTLTSHDYPPATTVTQARWRLARAVAGGAVLVDGADLQLLLDRAVTLPRTSASQAAGRIRDALPQAAPVEHDNCSRPYCGRPRSEHEMGGTFCP